MSKQYDRDVGEMIKDESFDWDEAYENYDWNFILMQGEATEEDEDCEITE